LMHFPISSSTCGYFWFLWVLTKSWRYLHCKWIIEANKEDNFTLIEDWKGRSWLCFGMWLLAVGLLLQKAYLKVGIRLKVLFLKWTLSVLFLKSAFYSLYDWLQVVSWGIPSCNRRNSRAFRASFGLPDDNWSEKWLKEWMNTVWCPGVACKI
jgi:hypothetical protein